MKVLFVNHLSLGSASSYRQLGFAKYLNKSGLDCDLLGRRTTLHNDATVNESMLDHGEWNDYHEIRSWKEPLAFNALSNAALLSKISKENSIVHVNRANPFTATLISAMRSPRWKLVVDMEDWDGFGGYSSYANKYNAVGGLLTFYERWFPRTANAVVVVSHLLEEQMVRAGVQRKKIFLIPNGFDPDLFNKNVSGREIRKEYDLGDSPVVIYASTYWNFEVKIHEIALATFRQIVKHIPEVKFILLGAGNISISNMASEIGLRKNVIVTGFVPRNRVPELIAAADVAMHVISDHPFHRASSPMIIPEYMAVGKPIVAPRIGELGVMLAGGAGYPVPHPEPNLLADGVIRLLNNDALRFELGVRAASEALEKYSYGVLAKILQQAYESISMGS